MPWFFCCQMAATVWRGSRLVHRPEIPANEYAVFAHDGHVSVLRNTFDSAVNDWLPASDFEMGRTGNGEPYVLERYGEKFDPMTGTGDIEIWIPVRGRSSR
jgi:AraC family transcriptional regulator